MCSQWDHTSVVDAAHASKGELKRGVFNSDLKRDVYSSIQLITPLNTPTSSHQATDNKTSCGCETEPRVWTDGPSFKVSARCWCVARSSRRIKSTCFYATWSRSGRRHANVHSCRPQCRVANSGEKWIRDSSLAFTLPGVVIYFSPYLNECSSGEHAVMQRPIRCPYNGLHLTFPMGALPVEKGPLCRPYVTVSQRVPFPVGTMGCSAVRKHDECPNRCPSNGEVPLQWIKCDAAGGSALKRWVQSCNSEEIRMKVKSSHC